MHIHVQVSRHTFVYRLFSCDAEIKHSNFSCEHAHHNSFILSSCLPPSLRSLFDGIWLSAATRDVLTPGAETAHGSNKVRSFYSPCLELPSPSRFLMSITFAKPANFSCTLVIRRTARKTECRRMCLYYHYYYLLRIKPNSVSDLFYAIRRLDQYAPGWSTYMCISFYFSL